MNQASSSVPDGADNGFVNLNFDLSQASIDDLLGAASNENPLQGPRKSSVAAPSLPILGGSNAPGRRYNKETWLAYQPIIQNLYISQGRPLRETVHVLEHDYGFKASEKQLKTKFKEWGFRKNKIVDGDDAAQGQDSPEQDYNVESRNNGGDGTLTEGLRARLLAD